MKRVSLVVAAVFAAIAVVACVKGASVEDAQHDKSRKPAVKSGELADSTAPGDRKPEVRDQSRAAAGEARDLCALLSAKEIEEITGLPIERAEKKPNGCEWYANAAAQQQKGADTARSTFEKLSKEEPKSAQEGVHSMENLLKGLGGAVAPDKPLFAVLVQRENADQGEMLLKGTVAVNGGGSPGGGLEPIDGLGDRAFMGAMGMLFYVRKGAVLITLGGMGTREQTIALARRIVPRIE